MSNCTEIAVFSVKAENIEEVLAVSEALFAEMNADQQVVLDHKILIDINDSEKVCWQLTWLNQAAIEASKAKWPSYENAKKIEALVGDKHFYAHFTELAAK